MDVDMHRTPMGRLSGDSSITHAGCDSWEGTEKLVQSVVSPPSTVGHTGFSTPSGSSWFFDDEDQDGNAAVLDFSLDFEVEEPQVENETAEPEEKELDPRRVAQRQKQIDFGKNTLGYQRYTQAVPKERRRMRKGYYVDPATPDVHQKCSKRCFDGQVKKWRRDLHKWDPTYVPGKDSDSEDVPMKYDEPEVKQELDIEQEPEIKQEPGVTEYDSVMDEDTKKYNSGRKYDLPRSYDSRKYDSIKYDSAMKHDSATKYSSGERRHESRSNPFRVPNFETSENKYPTDRKRVFDKAFQGSSRTPRSALGEVSHSAHNRPRNHWST